MFIFYVKHVYRNVDLESTRSKDSNFLIDFFATVNFWLTVIVAFIVFSLRCDLSFVHIQCFVEKLIYGGYIPCYKMLMKYNSPAC